jgi:azurin
MPACAERRSVSHHVPRFSSVAAFLRATRSYFLLGGAVMACPLHTLSAEVIRIGTIPGLRYDVSEFSVKPGTEVEVAFNNSDEMLHNFVITKPGARLAVVEAAIALGDRAADRHFVPETPNVLWATPVVPSGQWATLKFTAPSQIGEYPYVCTFPGHGFVMFGTMIVTPNPRPVVMTPQPKSQLDEAAHHTMEHGRPIVRRFFMPEAGPASIAVKLSDGFSYCWDAGACRFRYAWKGDFIEMPDRGTAKVLGEVFYRETDFPLRIGSDPEKVHERMEFHGYTLDAAGVPEFEYSLDGVKVRERIEVKDGKLVRRFRSDALNLWFAVPGDHARQLSSATSKVGSFYHVGGETAGDLIVILNPLAH